MKNLNKLAMEAPQFGDADTLVATIEGELEMIQGYAQDLLGHAKTLSQLLNATERKRAGRSEHIKVLEYELDGMRIIGQVQSQISNRIYQSRITLDPRAHNCQCRDWQDSRGAKGPCKHILALGRAFWDQDLIPELQSLYRPLKDIVSNVVIAPDSIG